MKKKVLAITTTLCFNQIAFAQSSVTLYGILDAGFIYLDKTASGSNFLSLQSGGIQGSRFGIKGTEDLGNDLYAIFQLESSLNLNSGRLGQGGRLFGRIATVGLSSPIYGTFMIGRQLDSYSEFVGIFISGTQWAAPIPHPGDVNNLYPSRRTSNAFKYTSSTYLGLTLSGTYSFGGVAGDFTKDQIWSVAARYVNGPFSIAAGYLNSRNPTFNIPDKDNPVYGGYASAHTYQSTAVGMAYIYGQSTIGLLYSNSQFKSLNDTTRALSGNAIFNNAEINYKYQIMPNALVGAAYIYSHGSDKSNAKAAQYHQFSLGTDYFLSKTTDLYATVGHQQAKGNNSFGKDAVATSVFVPSNNSSQTSVMVGMRHKF